MMNQEEHTTPVLKLNLKQQCDSSLCDYSASQYVLAKGNITVNNTAAADAGASITNKKVIFKNFPPFTDCRSEINNTKVDNAKYIDIVMAMFNLIE